jgi:ABC-2 type transport system permease protein
MIFFALSLLLLSSMPLSLLIGTALDLQHFAAALLGVLLLTAAFSAIGLYLSTLSAQPVVAAVSTFGILLLLWMLDWAGSQGDDAGMLNYLSLLTHYQVLVQGLVSSVAVLYYLLLTALFLVLSIHRLDLERVH